MSTTNDDRLKAAAQEGDIDRLYTLIDEDPSVLERIDSIPFVETPLHIAASFGQLQFATEVMSLKPSFARKLNPQGFSPIHLAMQQGQERMVHRFVDIDKDLVRVKGRGGLTPLHLASASGEVDLLVSFLSACPKSIEDVTVRGETALHIAVKSNKYEALQVLLGWLRITTLKEDLNLGKTVRNRKDEEGNTILHISARNNDLQALGLLVKTRMDLNAKNLENKTALDIATDAEVKIMLRRAGAQHGSLVTDASTLAKKLRSKITAWDEIRILIIDRKRFITEAQRNAYLVVVALLVSTAVQSAMSATGFVYQASAGDNNVNSNTTSLNSSAAATQIYAGAAVFSATAIDFLSVDNTVFLLLSICTMVALTPRGPMGDLLCLQVYLFFANYMEFVEVICPTSTTSSSGFSHIATVPLMFTLLRFIFHNRRTILTIGHAGLERLLREVRTSYNIWLARLQSSN